MYPSFLSYYTVLCLSPSTLFIPLYRTHPITLLPPLPKKFPHPIPPCTYLNPFTMYRLSPLFPPSPDSLFPIPAHLSFFRYAAISPPPPPHHATSFIRPPPRPCFTQATPLLILTATFPPAPFPSALREVSADHSLFSHYFRSGTFSSRGFAASLLP